MRINKFVIAGAVTIILFTLLAFVLFIAKNQPTSSSQIPPNWISQTTSEYTVSYPKDSQIKIDSIIGGGGSSNSITLNGYGERKPVILIQGVSSSSTSVDKIQSLFEVLEYLETPIIVGGQNATKLTSNFPKDPNNLPVIHEVIVPVQNKGTVYTIRLSYTATDTDANLESIFDQFLSSLQFN